MRPLILLMMSGLLGVEYLAAEPNAGQNISEQEYAQVSKQILDRVMALKGTFASMGSMTSAIHYEYNVTWVLDEPTEPPGKINGRRAVFGKDGYWFTLQFYRGQWHGAAVFFPIEFGDLKLWFQYGHDGNREEILAVARIVSEEKEAFYREHPRQSPNENLKATGEPAP